VWEEHVGGLPITGDLIVGKVHHAGVPLCHHGHGRACSKTLDVELTLMVCAGVGEELTGVSPVAGDLVSDEHPPVKGQRCRGQRGHTLPLTWLRMSAAMSGFAWVRKGFQPNFDFQKMLINADSCLIHN
jgi:hypothetical protein